MKFDTIDKSISPASQADAQKKLQWLSLELGVREDNQHVGTGLGGNNGQLVALMSFHHELIKDDTLTMEPERGLMRWGSSWFGQASRKAVRYEVDAKVPIAKYTPLDQVINDPRYSLGPNISSWNVMFYAENICKKLADELDRGDESNVQATAFALIGFPMETILMSVRKHIQIERLVRHNLDEHPDFEKVLRTINKTVDN